MARTKKKTRQHVPGQITLHHKGYAGVADWDDEAKIYHGTIVNIGKDVVTFQSDSFVDLSQAFHDSVEDYIEAKKDVWSETANQVLQEHTELWERLKEAK